MQRLHRVGRYGKLRHVDNLVRLFARSLSACRCWLRCQNLAQADRSWSWKWPWRKCSHGLAYRLTWDNRSRKTRRLPSHPNGAPASPALSWCHLSVSSVHLNLTTNWKLASWASLIRWLWASPGSPEGWSPSTLAATCCTPCDSLPTHSYADERENDASW